MYGPIQALQCIKSVPCVDIRIKWTHIWEVSYDFVYFIALGPVWAMSHVPVPVTFSFPLSTIKSNNWVQIKRVEMLYDNFVFWLVGLTEWCKCPLQLNLSSFGKIWKILHCSCTCLCALILTWRSWHYLGFHCLCHSLSSVTIILFMRKCSKDIVTKLRIISLCDFFFDKKKLFEVTFSKEYNQFMLNNVLWLLRLFRF